jgi:hypothetical protein
MGKKIFLLSAAIIYTGLSILYLIAGHIHNTEGGYVYVSKLVFQGKRPYIDFAYNQTPLYPYILGLPLYFLGYHVYSGRFCSFFFSILGFFLCLRLAKKLGGTTATLITAGLLAFNSFQIYCFIITKMYALTALVLILAIYILYLPIKKPGHYCLAVAILTVGVGIRLTLLPALLTILSGIIILEWPNKKNFIYPVLTFIGMGLLIFVPFAMPGWEQFYYNIIGHNLDITFGDISKNLLVKLRVINELVRYYFFSIILLTFIISYRLAKISRMSSLKEWVSHCFSSQEVESKSRYLPMLWLVVIIMTASHVLAKFPQTSYQTTIFPTLALLAGVSLSRIYNELKSEENIRSGLNIAFVVGCILTLLSYGRTSLAPTNNRHSPIFIKEEVAFLKAHTKPEDLIISCDTPLIAVEAQRDLLPGFAWNEYYPEWPIERARKLVVVNNELFKKYLSAKTAQAVIFSDASFTLSFPSFRPLAPKERDKVIKMIQKYYYLAQTFPNIYNSELNTYIYLPK